MAALPPNLSPTSSASQAILLCFEEEHEIASRLTQAAHMACALVPRHRFPFWCGALAHLF
jgi:hypothetical protein